MRYAENQSQNMISDTNTQFQKTITQKENIKTNTKNAQFGRSRAEPGTPVQMEKSETMRTKNESGRRSQKGELN